MLSRLPSSIAALLCLVASTGAMVAQTRPNVIVMLVDDLAWVDSSDELTTMGNGSNYHETPNIDSLAAQGLAFTRGYVHHNCSPTRVAYMTGQAPFRTNVYNVGGWWGVAPDSILIPPASAGERYIPNSATTIAELLKANGYATAHFGKFNGGEENTIIAYHGFEANYGGTQKASPISYFPSSSAGVWTFDAQVSPALDPYASPYTQAYIDANLKPFANGSNVDSLVGTRKHLTDATIDAAVDFMNTKVQADKNFFMSICFHAIHCIANQNTVVEGRPDLVAKYAAKTSTDPRHNRVEYAAIIEGVDVAVGRLMARLEDPNGDGNTADSVAENTVVFFFSDNGGSPVLTSNLPLRGTKATFWEGGIRVPMIVRWKGTIQPRVINNRAASMLDLYPTIAGATGTPLPSPASHPLDGVSFADLFHGAPDTSRSLPIAYHWPGHTGQASSILMRDIGGQRYKLFYYYETGNTAVGHYEFYNLTNDLAESNNLLDAGTSSPEYEIAVEMSRELRQWLNNTNAPYATIRATGARTPAPTPLQLPPDSTPPTITGIDDGDADDIVDGGTTLQYSVTFSSNIDGTTASAADFDNAGTSLVRIGAVAEPLPGTLTVEVTPLTAGTVILRVPPGAVISDLSGNNLAVPVQDDTTVTVSGNAPGYTVTYDANGATSGTAPAAQTKYQDIPLSLADNSGNLTKTDFTFAGWNTAPDGTGTSYAAGGSYTANADLTLYAKWTVTGTYTWDGGGADANWGSANNWNPNGTPTFNNTADVVFYSAAANLTTFLGSGKTIRSLTFNDDADSNVDIRLTTTSGGTTAANLTFNGGGSGATITVAAGAAANQYMIGQGGVTGQIILNENLVIDNNGSGTLAFGRPVTGNYSITKNGTGQLSLARANNNIYTYSGGFIMNDGSLQTASPTGFGTGAVTFNGGTIKHAPAADIAIANNVVVANSAIVKTLLNGSSYNVTYSGDFTLNELDAGDFKIEITNTGNLLLDGIISGVGGIEKTGAGTGFLRLGNANTFTGITKVTAGELRLNNLGAIRNSALDTTGSGFITANAGAGNYVIGGLIGGRDLSAVFTGSPANVTSLTLNPQGGSVTYNNVIANLSTGMSLTKTGAGTQILGGANTYTGTTLVEAGALIVNGSLHGSSAVTVSANGTLGGSGTIHGPVTANGTVSPGNSTGVLTSGGATFETGSRLAIEIDDSATPRNDALVVDGALVINGGSLDFAIQGVASEPVYTLATYTGSPPAEFPAVTNQPSGYDLVYNHNGNSVALVKQAGSDPYTGWVATHPAITGNNQAPDADFDRDGLPNGIEFLIGSDPASFTDPSAPGYPNVTISGGNGMYAFKRTTASHAYSAVIETSPDLVSWNQSFPIPANDGTAGPVEVSGETVTFTFPLESETFRFLRLKAQVPFAP